MLYRLHPRTIHEALIELTPSKSISNRVLMIKALSGSDTMPQNLSVCDDTRAMLAGIGQQDGTVDVGHAGTAMRFLTALYAVKPQEHLLTGSDRMKQRPIGTLVDALRFLGATIDYQGAEGYPPLHISGGELQGGEISLTGSVSSQFISALLMIGPVLRKGLLLHLEGHMVSRPYIDLTLWTMNQFGADAEWESANDIIVRPKPYVARPFLIENDWTAASYWYELLALSGQDDLRLRLNNLSDYSLQGDNVVKYIFNMLGIKTVFSNRESAVPGEVLLKCHNMKMPRLDMDCTNCPDLAQTIVATCVGMDIPFHLKGLQTLLIKETNRIDALVNEMKKLGILLHAENDAELVWNGEKTAMSWEPIETYNDHRMAMAFAPLCLKFPGLAIKDPDVVSKSYPSFWEQLQAVGVEIEAQES